MKQKYIQTWLLTLIISFFLTACQKDPEIISLSGKTMGTSYHIKYIDSGNLQQNAENAELRGKVDEVNQIYFDYGLGGYLQWSNPYFKGLDFAIRGLSDYFQSKEINVKAQPSFEVLLTDEQKVNANVLVDYYDGSFTRKDNLINDMDNRWMLFGVNPSYQLVVDNLNVKLGVSLMYVDANKSVDSKFKAYRREIGRASCRERV